MAFVNMAFVDISHQARNTATCAKDLSSSSLQTTSWRARESQRCSRSLSHRPTPEAVTNCKAVVVTALNGLINRHHSNGANL